MADASTAKPPSVQRAVISLWTSVGLTVVITGLQVLGIVPVPVPAPGAAVAAMTGFITAGLLALVALNLARRRGWVRWLFLVLYMLGSFAFIVSFLFAPGVFVSMPTLAKGSAILQFGLQTLALFFMFGRMSREWLKAAHVATAL